MDVLLVEDHQEVRGALCELLQAEGFVVTAVSSAEEGLRHFEQKTFSLLVTDQTLPGQSGTELVMELRRRGVVLPTLMITASTQMPDVTGVRVLFKPMDLDVFVATVHALLDRHASPAELPPRSTPPVQLRLYVSSSKAPSIRATARLRAVLERYAADDFRIEIFDFERGIPAQADADRVLGTPSLLVELPDGRRTWLVGDLRNTESLELVLDASGTRRR